GEFVASHPNTARAVTAAIIEAGKWIDASPANRRKTAETIAAKSYVNTAADAIVHRMLGRYTDGLGKTWDDAHPMRFYADGAACLPYLDDGMWFLPQHQRWDLLRAHTDYGAVCFPYLCDGMWFLTQHKRWGLLKAHPDYRAVAGAINRIDIYRQAAAAAGAPLPASEMRQSVLMDGVRWDGADPAAYADAFSIKA